MTNNDNTIAKILLTNEKISKKMGRKMYKVVNLFNKEITKEDCIIYMQNNLVNNRSVYNQVEILLGKKLDFIPDKLAIRYELDFCIIVKNQYIGIQIKPVSEGIQLSQIFKERNLQEKTHQKFTKKYGGKVFYIFSKTVDTRKVIMNPEVIDEIREEINRLNG
ncbi:MAG: MjaI family restriction endonuclease [Candidatus Cloacimonetes bacterium]|nr:MjaI family restriction endonuclease [Candidatus Cloacimonadota bacterium]